MGMPVQGSTSVTGSGRGRGCSPVLWLCLSGQQTEPPGIWGMRTTPRLWSCPHAGALCPVVARLLRGKLRGKPCGLQSCWKRDCTPTYSQINTNHYGPEYTHTYREREREREREISTAIHSSQKTNYEIVKSTSSTARMPSVWLSSCVTLDKLLNLSGP